MKTALGLLFWFGIVVVVPLVIGIRLENTTMAWMAFVVGAFITFISRLDQMTELSFGPLRARMREKIEEADETLERLRETAATMSKASLGHMMASSFWAGLSLAQRFKLHDEVISNLRTLGASETQVEEADKIWKGGIPVIYTRAIGNALRGAKSSEDRISPTDEQQALAVKIDEMSDLDDNWRVATSEEIRRLLEDAGELTTPVKKWVDDYHHFEETGEIRDLDQFVKM